MNKQQVSNLICNRIWIYQSVTKSDPNPVLLNLVSKDKESIESFLSIIFHPNGRISIPTKVGFFPREYSNWDFNEQTQEIIFINSDNQSEIRAKLPQKLSYGVDAIKLKAVSDSPDKEILFVNDAHFDCFEISTRFLGGKKVFFTPREAFDYSLRYSLRWSGFNIKLIDHNNSLTKFFSDVYDYLALRPHLEQIVVSQKSKNILELPKEHELLFLDNQGIPSLTYFSGKRSVIMEFLITVISENNLRLFDDSNQRNEKMMLQDILTTYFKERYELRKILDF